MSYYGDSQWPAGAQPTAWDHQTPPTRSGLPPNNILRDSTSTPIDTADPGASSTVPREESSAFSHQFEGTFPAQMRLSNDPHYYPWADSLVLQAHHGCNEGRHGTLRT